MRNIYSLILLIFLVQYALSSTDGVTLTITGPIDQSYNGCSGNVFYFFFPVTYEAADEYMDKTLFSLELEYPKGLKADCKIYQQPNIDSLKESEGTEGYVICTIDPGNTLLYKEPVKLKSKYDWPEDVTVVDYEKHIGSNPVVKEAVDCPKPTYEITLLEKLQDQCDSQNNKLHHLTASVNYIKNKGEYLTSSTELKFPMYLYLNLKVVEAACTLTEVSEGNGSELEGDLDCTFSGNGEVQIPPQVVDITDTTDNIYLPRKDTFKLPVTCPPDAPTPTPPSDSPDSNSSYLSLSILLMIAMILL
jgi:hypothetical protein